MTDQIELPPVPQSPPVVSLADADYEEMPPVIFFDRSMNNELLVNLNIRDEDVTEPLTVRWRIVSLADRPPGAREREYPCPDTPLVPGGGSLTRRHTLTVQGSSFARGKCSRVDVIVSGSFKQCRPDRDDRWDITTQVDDESDIGRLSFFVFDTSDNPEVSPAAALAIVTSCPKLDYQPPSPTASATSATSLEP